MKCEGVRVAAAILLAISSAAPALAEGDRLSPNWTAPQYWMPSAAGGVQGAPDARDTARSGATRTPEGRQALAASPTALPFISLFPCRLVDTRSPVFVAPLGGGFLPQGTVRSYTLTGVCNVPANAQAISLNATVVNPVGPGFLVLYAEGGTVPPVSTLNYVGHEVVANAAVVPLSASGGISMVLGVSGGDVILDTNGYYSPQAATVPYGRAIQTVGQGIPRTWDPAATLIFDTMEFSSETALFNGGIVVSRAGLYEISARIVVYPTAAGQLGIWAAVNGVDDPASSTWMSDTCQFARLKRLNAGDYVQVKATQNMIFSPPYPKTWVPGGAALNVVWIAP